ncbi:DUF4395 domain-containing protein [Actinospica sp.]|jgi:hypothetical protein|uniref:DUF4395 domain-containing protein n=1 Tax=Actinospica sp. TaxID=1872142 RepID=UPI002B62FF69|nr:DUF4395 domain-containing protein [Actinospica sp.]HWG22562.1 DUF4395 domain-containing protein [Actinospica sp.]
MAQHTQTPDTGDSTDRGAAPLKPFIDPRGPRFGAAITTVVLVVVLATGWGWLLAAQAIVFALSAFSDLRLAPYGWLYRRFVRPRLGPPTELENPAPPIFAQFVGLGFALVGSFCYLVGWDVAAMIATGLALAAAFLNAAFDYCLGCEVYLLLHRAAPRRRPA